jgi:hypothetical protein
MEFSPEINVAIKLHCDHYVKGKFPNRDKYSPMVSFKKLIMDKSIQMLVIQSIFYGFDCEIQYFLFSVKAVPNHDFSGYLQ